MKVIVWTPLGRRDLLRHLAQDSAVECVAVDKLEALEAGLADCEVLVTLGGNYSPALAALLRDRAPRLRLLQLLTAGYEKLEALGTPPGVIVSNAGDAWSPAVADHAVTLMLALFRQLPATFAAQQRHAWDSLALATRLRSPSGRTLVILGYGSIGREAARRAHAFGMHVIGVSRSARKDEDIDEAMPVERLDAALARADVILVCVPSSLRTRGMLGTAQFAACRPGTLLVNIARGDIVDRNALLEALRSGQLGGAAIDVTDPEPLAADDALWDVPNLMITPHVSGHIGPEGALRLATIVGDNVLRFARGEAPLYQVSLAAS